MTIEKPDGEYARVRTSTKRLYSELYNNNKNKYKSYDFKFFFVPKGYFQISGNYIFAFEMRAYNDLKSGKEYYFIAENFFVEYSKDEMESLLDDNEERAILDKGD